MQYLQRPEKVIGSFGTGVIDGCHHPCECWKLNPGPLQEEGVPLKVTFYGNVICFRKGDEPWDPLNGSPIRHWKTYSVSKPAEPGLLFKHQNRLSNNTLNSNKHMKNSLSPVTCLMVHRCAAFFY